MRIQSTMKIMIKDHGELHENMYLQCNAMVRVIKILKSQYYQGSSSHGLVSLDLLDIISF